MNPAARTRYRYVVPATTAVSEYDVALWPVVRAGSVKSVLVVHRLTASVVLIRHSSVTPVSAQAGIEPDTTNATRAKPTMNRRIRPSDRWTTISDHLTRRWLIHLATVRDRGTFGRTVRPGPGRSRNKRSPPPPRR